MRFPAEALGRCLAEGAFPHLQELACNPAPPVSELLGLFSEGAPCFSNLRRLKLWVDDGELDHLARLLRPLLNLPMLEHVEISSRWGPDWRVTGGQETLLELEGVLGRLERGGSVEEVRKRVHEVMCGRYGCLRG
jgi:hypothetical protein